MTEKASMNCRWGKKKEYLSHLLLHSRSNPNILSTNKSTFQFIKSVNWIQVAVPRQALYCVPYCILQPWWMGCQLRKTGWFQLKTLSAAAKQKEKNRQDSSEPMWVSALTSFLTCNSPPLTIPQGVVRESEIKWNSPCWEGFWIIFTNTIKPEQQHER